MRRRNVWLVAVAVAAVAASTSSAAGAERLRLAEPVAPPGPAFVLATPSLTLDEEARLRVRASGSWGGTYRTAAGEHVTVRVSDAYPLDEALAQRWADYLGSLVHGPELSLVRLYLAPLAEVAKICGPEALGCYGDNEIIATGDPVGAVSPTQIVAHEYGHHVAAHRANAPWNPIDWGPKRWATYAGICARARAGTAFPGDEDSHYLLNPGEGFAEVYRLLNETRAGATAFAWPVVDQSFYPDASALQAAEEDVLEPWTSPSSSTKRARFRSNGSRSSWFSITTPLDGDVHVRLTMPLGAAYELTVLESDGTQLARGALSGDRTVTADALVCGERSLIVRVARRGPAGSFSIDLSYP
jgi:hypothetical protein